ncbi:MAG: c-type cytochrome [Rubrivivax sp.]
MKSTVLMSELMYGAALSLALSLAMPVSAADDAAAAAKADPAKGEAIATQVCSACHTINDSRGTPANPILQHQHPEYLAKQLADFKAGVRDNAIMKGFASTLSAEDMKNVAAFYATKVSKPGFAKNKDTLAMAEKIYRGGIADRKIPACAGCHSPTGSGIPSQYPRLGGQHSEYTEAQLVKFRSGERANNLAMAGVAAKLNDREIKALADYITGLR